MVFHEIYGSYYAAVAKILDAAQKGGVNQRTLEEIVRETGFQESILTIPEALNTRRWPFLREDGTTTIQNPVSMPLTLLEKRWLKTLLQDPRIRLFGVDETGLEDVKPLYAPDTFVYYDQYTDGDPYEDLVYIRNFRTIIWAIKKGKMVEARFFGRHGSIHKRVIRPLRLEYSRKDDKFRLIGAGSRNNMTINVARITGCRVVDFRPQQGFRWKLEEKAELKLELTDKRNALERALLHFSHLEKETRRLEENRYEIILKYDPADETELLIRVLSFGPMLKVISPEDFVEKLYERLKKQKSCGLP